MTKNRIKWHASKNIKNYISNQNFELMHIRKQSPLKQQTDLSDILDKQPPQNISFTSKSNLDSSFGNKISRSFIEQRLPPINQTLQMKKKKLDTNKFLVNIQSNQLRRNAQSQLDNYPAENAKIDSNNSIFKTLFDGKDQANSSK